MYSTLWHSYKTFISATRPNSLLRWVLDIRDQCFLAHVITHSALSAILALCCSEKYFIWTSKTVSSNPTPTSTGLHLVTITKLPSETQRPLTIHSKKDIWSRYTSYMNLAVNVFTTRLKDFIYNKIKTAIIHLKNVFGRKFLKYMRHIDQYASHI